MAETNVSNRLTYFLIGLGIGAVGAFLIVPKLRKNAKLREGMEDIASLFTSKLGKELRDRIEDVTQNGFRAAHEIANELAEKGRVMATDFVSSAKETVPKTKEQLSATIEEATDTFIKSMERLWEAIEIAKQAYREEKRKAEQ